jgi:hypothetical protein
MIRIVNFWWNSENYYDSPHLRGKIDGFFARRESGNIKLKHKWVTLRHLCTNCRPIVGSAGSAGPGRSAAPTGFFLERASLIPTWTRPLVRSRIVVEMQWHTVFLWQGCLLFSTAWRRHCAFVGPGHWQTRPQRTQVATSRQGPPPPTSESVIGVPPGITQRI